MERHFHFNILSAIWFLFFLVVVINVSKFVVNKWYIPGLTELVNNI